MSLDTKSVGNFEGQRVDAVTLTSDTGHSVEIMSWGVTVRDWQVPVPGGTRSVALGFDSFEPYPEHSPYLGAIAGRVANRIAFSRFELEGRTYTLEPNFGPHHLHGGPGGIGRQVWTLETDEARSAARFTHVSPDGAMGYPGTVRFEAIYRLEGNRLTLELSGIPDRVTPVSLVQHQYFNLGATNSVLNHRVAIAAGARTELGDELIPTGAILPVAGTDYDLRAGRTLRRADGQGIDYDLNYALDSARDTEMPVAEVVGEDGLLRLRLWTDRPGLQFYNGVWTDVSVPGIGGRRYGKHSGLCLEDQMFPDALHHRHFPSILVSPDAPYRHWSSFEIAAA